MKPGAFLMLALSLGAGLPAAEPLVAPPAPGPTAVSTPVPTPAPSAEEAPDVIPLHDPANRATWNQSGVEYCLAATGLSVFNGAPLSYTPFELGWRFRSGLHIRSGVDLFYYEGPDTDAKKPETGTQNYSYDMLDWRSSLLYSVPLPLRIKPIVGMTVEVVRGTRKLAGPGVVAPPSLEAWGFLGPGAVLGAEWRLTENWAVELLTRYTFSFGNAGSVTAVGLDMAYLF